MKQNKTKQKFNIWLIWMDCTQGNIFQGKIIIIIIVHSFILMFIFINSIYFHPLITVNNTHTHMWCSFCCCCCAVILFMKLSFFLSKKIKLNSPTTNSHNHNHNQQQKKKKAHLNEFYSAHHHHQVIHMWKKRIDFILDIKFKKKIHIIIIITN